MKPIQLPANAKSLFLSGIPEPATAAFTVRQLQEQTHSTAILLDNDLGELEFWARELQFYLRLAGMENQFQIGILPGIPDGEIEKERFFDIYCDRLGALTKLLEYRQPKDCHKRLIILTTPTALFQACPTPDFLQNREIRIRKGDHLPFGQFTIKLAEELGYYSEVLCETPGEFAVRGGLVDVYPLNANAPHRIDFFGDEVDQIRVFDPTNQRTLEEVDEIIIGAAPEGKDQEASSDVIGYLPPEILWIVREPSRLTAEHSAWFNHPDNFENPHRDFRDIFQRDKGNLDGWVALGDVDNDPNFFRKTKNRQEFTADSASTFLVNIHTTERELDEFETLHEHRRKFLKELQDWQRQKIYVVLVCRTERDRKKVQSLLDEQKDLKSFKPGFEVGDIHEGFRLQHKEFRSTFPKFADKAPNGIAFIGTDDI
ncbi:MAG: hypothetical protein HN996_00120, partial [Opitutae bacterium]|nr:hypothetical protein [Opitutae bacterium]